jgi:hypothetical protein
MEAICSSDSLMNSIYLKTNFIQVRESLLMFYPYCINFLATGLRFLLLLPREKDACLCILSVFGQELGQGETEIDKKRT